MIKDVRVYLDDIKECMARIEEYVGNISQATFFENPALQDAVVRRLEIIGEAVKNIPEELKAQYSAVPWKEIAGMRDVLIHEYSGVNLGRVWNTIEDDIPALKREIEAMLTSLDQTDKRL